MEDFKVREDTQMIQIKKLYSEYIDFLKNYKMPINKKLSGNRQYPKL